MSKSSDLDCCGNTLTTEFCDPRRFTNGTGPGCMNLTACIMQVGPRGASNYELWLQAGNTGSLIDYMTYLTTLIDYEHKLHTMNFGNFTKHECPEDSEVLAQIPNYGAKVGDIFQYETPASLAGETIGKVIHTWEVMEGPVIFKHPMKLPTYLRPLTVNEVCPGCHYRIDDTSGLFPTEHIGNAEGIPTQLYINPSVDYSVVEQILGGVDPTTVSDLLTQINDLQTQIDACCGNTINAGEVEVITRLTGTPNGASPPTTVELLGYSPVNGWSIEVVYISAKISEYYQYDGTNFNYLGALDHNFPTSSGGMTTAQTSQMNANTSAAAANASSITGLSTAISDLANHLEEHASPVKWVSGNIHEFVYAGASANMYEGYVFQLITGKDASVNPFPSASGTAHWELRHVGEVLVHDPLVAKYYQEGQIVTLDGTATTWKLGSGASTADKEANPSTLPTIWLENT